MNERELEVFTWRAFTYLSKQILPANVVSLEIEKFPESQYNGKSSQSGLITLYITNRYLQMHPEAAKTLMVFTIIHELFHTMQYIDQEYSMDEEVQSIIESEANVFASWYLNSNKDAIQRQLEMTLYFPVIGTYLIENLTHEDLSFLGVLPSEVQYCKKLLKGKLREFGFTDDHIDLIFNMDTILFTFESTSIETSICTLIDKERCYLNYIKMFLKLSTSKSEMCYFSVPDGELNEAVIAIKMKQVKRNPLVRG